MNDPLDDFVPENLRMAPPQLRSASAVRNHSWLQLIVYPVAADAALWLIVHCVSGITEANEEARKDSERSVRLDPLVVRQIRTKQLQAQTAAEQAAHERDLARIQAGTSLEELEREKERERQRQVAEDLKAIRRELERRR